MVRDRLLAASLILMALWPAERAQASEAEKMPSAEQGSPAVSQCTVIHYATNPIYPPYGWKTNSGQYDGAVVELLHAIVPKGISLEPMVYPWKRSMVMAEMGGIDLLAGIRKTPEREKTLEFTTHRAFPNPIVLFVAKDRQFPFSTWEDLAMLRGGVSAGDAFGGGFDEYWRLNLIVEEARTMKENFQKLELGHIDYFVTSRLAGEAYLRTHFQKIDIISLSPPISNQDIHLAFSRHSPCRSVIPAMSARLAEMDSKGALDALLKKHLQRYIAEGGVSD
jgi:polar amino acid transport system substrate-binding protein